MIAVDQRNADAKARLLLELTPGPAGWRVVTEQELTAQDNFVARVAHPAVRGHATIEANGYRPGGGYQYTVMTFDSSGVLVKGPSAFSYTSHAVHWARQWLLEG